MKNHACNFCLILVLIIIWFIPQVSFSAESGNEVLNVPRISGKQLDQIRKKFQKSEMLEKVKIRWSTVHWASNESHVIVHIRMDNIKTDDLIEASCNTANK